jgi:hypothetical protein
MTAPNNSLLYNAAAEGLVAGAIKGRWLTAKNSGTPPAIGTPDPSYAALAAQVTQLATEFDSKVANDHAGAAQPTGTQAISVVTTGVAIVPSTGAIQFGELIKTRLMAGLSLSVLEGRPYTAVPSAELLNIANAVSAIYLDAAAFVVQPADFLVSVNNQLLIFAAIAGALAGFNLGGNTSFPTDNSNNVTAFIGYALALGEGIDTLIANDASISAGAGTGNGGAAIAPEPDSNAVIQLNQSGKVRLMYSCVLAYLESRSATSITIGGAAPDAAAITAWGATNAPAIVALYKAGLVNLQLAPVNLFNPELWNQAYCGYIEGVMSGRPFTATSSTDANYVAVALAAKAFATEVDTTVGASDVSSGAVPTGTSPITFLFQESPPLNSDIVPTTGTITEAQAAKGGLMWAICRGVMWGRSILGIPATDNTAATYAPIAASIVALYLELTTVLNTP